MNPTGVLKSKRWCIKGTVQQREVKMDFNRMFVHVCVHQRLRTDRHSNKTCRITITLRVYDPTFMSAGGDGDGVSDVSETSGYFCQWTDVFERFVSMFVTSETSWMFFGGTVRTSPAQPDHIKQKVQQEPAATVTTSCFWTLICNSSQRDRVILLEDYKTLHYSQ